MQREELADGVVCYLGDCRDVIPTLPKVDACVTDPPYGIGLKTDNSRFSGGDAASISRRGNGVGPSNGAPIVGDDVAFDPKLLLFGKAQIIWGWHNFPDKLPRGACLIWIKRLDAAFGSFLSDAETAWYSRGHGVYCFRDLSMTAEAINRVHPTQKPVTLMRWCIDRLPADTRTILDPFMGSGTTGVAAVKLGRKFIGVEIEPRYFEIAVRRISEALKQPDLFIEKPKPAAQEALAL